MALIKKSIINKQNLLLFTAVAAVTGAVLLLVFMSGNKSYTGSFFSMGSFIRITSYGKSCEADIKQAVTALDNDISRQVASSSVSRLNAGAELKLSEELTALLRLCAELEEKTGGLFNIKSGALTALWDFDSGLENVPAAEDIANAVEKTKKSVLVFGDTGCRAGNLDLGSVGKGLACDAAAEIMKGQGVSGVIAVGGSIACVGDKNGSAWTIAVKDPFSASQASILTIQTGEAFISTSGSYEKSFEKDGRLYHHILNPITGYPVENDLVSVTIISDNGALSDALSTAVFAVGFESGILLCNEYNAQAILINKDGAVYATEGLKEKITSDTEINFLA